MSALVRICMWSGPRNISTAMMRSFENRPDCAVSDEPFYAAYLAETGLDHPMRAEVLASQPTDWRAVAAQLAGPAPGGAAVWYQKHMTHHMLDGFGLDWADGAVNAFLIRDPARVLASYVVKRGQVTLADIGVERQRALFEREADRLGAPPPVALELLVGPEGGLDAGEAAAAESVGYRPLRLGPRVLRTETAGMAALAAIQARWGDFV